MSISPRSLNRKPEVHSILAKENKGNKHNVHKQLLHLLKKTTTHNRYFTYNFMTLILKAVYNKIILLSIFSLDKSFKS